MSNPTGVSLVLATLILPAFSLVTPVVGETYVHRSYQWTYDGSTWTWAIDIPQSLYDGYASVSESNRRLGEANGYLVTTKDPLMQSIATSFRKAASEQGYGSYDEASLLLAWVQSLPYTSDSVTSPYDDFPRFPVETLYANGGDCEDTTYLYLTIMRIWGYGSVIINPPQHFAAGILGGSGLTGYYYQYNGRNYYYAETTGDGFRIGDVPFQFDNVSANIWLITVEGYAPSWSGSATATADPNTSNPNQSTQNPSGVYTELLNALLPYLIIVVILLVVAVGAVALEEARKKRGVTAVPSLPPLSFCPSCGVPTNPYAEHCSRCGVKLRVGFSPT